MSNTPTPGVPLEPLYSDEWLELFVFGLARYPNPNYDMLREVGELTRTMRDTYEAARNSMKGRRWTEAEEEKLRALLLSGLPPHQIAKRLGRTTRAIRTRWLKLGLGRRQLLSLKMIERNKQHK